MKTSLDGRNLLSTSPGLSKFLCSIGFWNSLGWYAVRSAHIGERVGVLCRARLRGTKREERNGYVHRGETLQVYDALKLEQKMWAQLCEAFKKVKS